MTGQNGRAPRQASQAVSAALPALQIARPQAVRLITVSDRTFLRLEAEGVFAPSAPGAGRRGAMYDAYTVVAGYLAYLDRKMNGGVESPRDRRDRSQAELNELRLARERRELLPRSQVVLEGQSFIKASIAKLRSLPSRLQRAGALGPSAEPIVTEVLREAQEEMARWSTQLDLLQACEDRA